MANVKFERLYKLFGSHAAVEDLSLEITDGEFLVMVGPSGCGKTTTLRMLAGLERPTYGRIFIGDRMVNTIPPKDRDIAMVFQSYALYPHMSVYDNLAFGMRVRRESKERIGSQVREVAEMLGIARLLGRKPGQLSGGERQRVALGRALIRHPQVFLMDEPLSNLDAALRVQMRAELNRLHARLGVTTVYVTHDQIEAMTIGDRIAVLCAGKLQQVDTPQVLYDCPANSFVAGFIGSPKMNLFPGRLTIVDGRTAVECLGTRFPLPEGTEIDGPVDHGEVTVGIRPEDVRWKEDAAAGRGSTVRGIVDFVEPIGAESFVTVRVGEFGVVARFPARSGVSADDAVDITMDVARLHLFDARTQLRVLKQSAAGSTQSSAAKASAVRPAL